MKDKDFKVLLDWTVTGMDRLIGDVYRPGHRVIRRVLTSPVVQVTALGHPPTFVALTQSGSRYCLGIPAERFTREGLEAFIARKFQAPPERPPAGPVQTDYEDLDPEPGD